MGWETTGMALLAGLGGYVLGCVCFGYYVVRLCVGEDIRDLGSGNVGAKNVGRRLGKAGFLGVTIGDMAKGSAAVLLAGVLTGSEEAACAAFLGALCGHLWPIQLGFRGGKGVATFGGALIALDPGLFVGLLFAFGLTFVASRRFTLSGLLGVAAGPFIALCMARSVPEVVTLFLAAVLVLSAHRRNIRDIWRSFGPAGDAGSEGVAREGDAPLSKGSDEPPARGTER